MKSINLNKDLNEIYTLTEFIEKIIQKKDFQIDLMLEEVLVNIVNYSKCEYITVNAEFENSILTVEFIDNGTVFNPLLKEDPKFPDCIEDAEIGGLGIYLTKKLADELEYNHINDENHLKIIKKVE
ncbi:ATP-binding protein [uncultured Methanobrevibacter sp.]|uniref:ATP-binding protein n=1 Tax=uncultured Methanobrevibacter sp. TaxID=253161 RepID=UPI0025E84F7B|nr:ATP-binding protein [uncultured Methanobrevibacter sp.]